jgi:hypothetical protein
VSTYSPIASVTLSSAQSSVTFSGIPQTYTDLVLVVNYTASSTNSVLGIQFNSDTGSNYSRTFMWGNGSAGDTSRSTSATSIGSGYWQTGTGNQVQSVTNVMNYSNSTTNKTVLTRWNQVLGTDNSSTSSVGLWRNTAAITSINLVPSAGNFASGSTFNLYGVSTANINTGKAIGGDNVYSDGTYWYHIFRSSGTFTPLQALTADYLVVAGGGAGGYQGGGGGAGGMRCTVTATGGGGSLESALALTAQAYTVTVGAGGASVNSGTVYPGSNSVFSTITSTGGGGGGSANTSGGNGGSGGGAPSTGTGSLTGGTGTANQGYAGGSYSNASPYPSGGGGGAGAVGGNGSSSTAGSGGAGVATSITGSSVTYAGGGGGGIYGSGTAGTGGSSIGGNGTQGSNTPTAGAANTGSGGGGGGAVAGGQGGSGIVIVRYAV